RVDVRHAGGAADRERLALVVRVRPVQVDVVLRCHHHGVAEFRGPTAHEAVLAPGHDDGVLRAVGVHDLVPADHAAAAGREPLRYLRHEPALQLGLGPQAERAHALPGAVAVVPFAGRALVAAEVDVRAGEDVHHLVEHVRAELDGGVIDIQDVPGNAPAGAHLDRLLPAVVRVRVAEFGVGRDG